MENKKKFMEEAPNLVIAEIGAARVFAQSLSEADVKDDLSGLDWED